MAQDVGTGAAITFGTSSWVGQLLSINQGDKGKGIIDITVLGTTGGSRLKRQTDLIDEGEVSLEFAFDPDVPPVITAAATGETVTITCPVPTGKVTGATYVGKGALNSFSFGMPLEDKMTGSATVTWLGKVTQTDSAT